MHIHMHTSSIKENHKNLMKTKKKSHPYVYAHFKYKKINKNLMETKKIIWNMILPRITQCPNCR